MFGHQDDQHHHHDGDNQHFDNAAMQPAVDGVLSTDEHGGTTMHDDHQQDFNPALPPHDAPVEESTTAQPAEDFVAAPSATNDLLSIKQQALTALSPLVGHLDQSPEEKFRTTMMLIQASDNHEMLNVAYEAAQAIEDDKVKAQALLDVVNEINYFTSQTSAV